MCLKSKAIGLIILLSLLAHLGLYFSLDSVTNILYDSFLNSSQSAVTIGYSIYIGSTYLVYPLCGLMGDVVFRRHKVIRNSLVILALISVMLIVAGCLEFVRLKHPFIFVHDGAVAVAVFGCYGLGIFFVNVIPYAMDQLRDSPTHESSVFIFWCVWTIFTASSIDVFISSVRSIIADILPQMNTTATDVISGAVGTTCFTAISVLILVISIASFFVIDRRQEWFNVEPRNVNPYKLVYRVTKFAFQHKVPVRRSAFTYCEDDPPSGLDLGKSKYGGPFAMEEVEDVKVFYEILKVLVSLGPFFYVIENSATSDIGHHISNNLSGKYVLFNGMLQSLLQSVAIPIYLYFSNYHKSLAALQSLRKVEISLIIVLIKLVFMLAVDIAAHVKSDGLSCMFNNDAVSQDFSHSQVVIILVTLEILSAVSITILYTSYLEFICAQSPHSMKGVLIGLAYAMLSGVFPLFGVILRILLDYWKHLSYFSCGFMYYSVHIGLALVSFILFVRAVKRYKYRERDEPCRVRQYAEEYYSNPQQEPNYDYSTSLIRV